MTERLNRVLTNDPGIGVARHADAGYDEARDFARTRKIKIEFDGFPRRVRLAYWPYPRHDSTGERQSGACKALNVVGCNVNLVSL